MAGRRRLTPEVIMTCDDVTHWYFRHYQHVRCDFGNGLWGGYTHANNFGFGSPYDGAGGKHHHTGFTWKYCLWGET